MKTNPFYSLAAIAVLTVVTTISQAQTACAQLPATINIAPNRLDKALSQLAGQISCSIKYDPRAAQAFHNSAVKGKLTPCEALIQLVKGTGLEVHLDKQLVVNQADQEAIGLKAATLQASLGQAIKAHTLTQQTANQMYSQLGNVRTSVVEVVKKQGFVSAAEKASYQRTFKQVQQLLASAKVQR